MWIEKSANIVQEIKTENYDAAIHGCNCFNTMNSGVAKSIKDAFPEVEEADRKTKKGSYNKLGTYTSAILPNPLGFKIYNLYSQYNYGYDKKVYANKIAIQLGLEKISRDLGENKRVIMPWIGCGRGGLQDNDLLFALHESGMLAFHNITICIKPDSYMDIEHKSTQR